MQTEFPIMGPSAEWMPIGEHRHTAEEYLAFEQAALDRHFFVDGKIFAMESVSWRHSTITVNLVASLGMQVKSTPYQVRAVATKVYSGPKIVNGLRGMFWYPDIVVIGADAKYYDPHTDVVLNPRAIVEIVSPLTEALDRGEKFTRLQTFNPSFTDSVLGRVDISSGSLPKRG